MSKSRNPGFKSGDHWLICDKCGKAIRSSKAKKTWDGLIVCPKDYETRQPQDFVRGVHDQVSAEGLVRLEPTDVIVGGYCTTRSGVAGYAVAGCAFPSYEEPLIPVSTF